MMERPPIRIEDWAVVESVSAPAWRTLEPGFRLTGYVIGHGTLPNGLICSSPIVHIDHAAGMVVTRNNVYHLGRRSLDYERWLLRREASRAA
jgi:hypothetical protein